MKPGDVVREKGRVQEMTVEEVLAPKVGETHARCVWGSSSGWFKVSRLELVKESAK